MARRLGTSAPPAPHWPRPAGGLAGAGQTLLTPLRRQLATSAPLVPPQSYEVVTAALGSFAGAVGAAVAAYDAGTGAGRDLPAL